MKIKLSVLFLVMTLFIVSTPVSEAQASQLIRVATINVLPGIPEEREYITFPDVQPMVINDRVFVPVRSLESIPLITKVEWIDGSLQSEGEPYANIEIWGRKGTDDDAETEAFAIWPDDKSIYMTTARGDSLTNNKISIIEYKYGSYPWDYIRILETPIAAQIIDNRMIVPLRTLEVLGFAEFSHF